MEKTVCSNCGSPNIKLIPAGVSKKTGRKYNAFWSCPDCKMTHNTDQKGKASEMGQISPKNDSLGAVMKRFDDIERMLADLQVDLDDLKNHRT